MRWLNHLVCTAWLCLLAMPSMASSGELAGSYAPTGDALYDRLAGMTLVEIEYRLGSDADPSNVDMLGSLLLSFQLFDKQQANPAYWESISCWLRQDKQQAVATAERVIEAGLATPGLFAATPPDTWYLDDEDRALKICDLAISLDPQNSYFYYQKAPLLISLGEWEAGLAAVRAGNAAPRNAVVWPYPLERIVRGEAGATPANHAAAGLIYAVYDDAQRWLRYTEFYRHLELALSFTDTGTALDDCLTMARRMGQMEGQSLAGVMCARKHALMLVRQASGGMGENEWIHPAAGFDLSLAQQAEAAGIHFTLGELERRAHAGLPVALQTGAVWPGGFILPLGYTIYGDRPDLNLLPFGPAGIQQLQDLGAAASGQFASAAELQPLFDCLPDGLLARWRES